MLSKKYIQLKLEMAKTAWNSDDISTAIGILDELVENGDLEATYRRAQVGIAKEPVSQFNERRLQLLRKCAEQEHPDALYELYVHYDTGDGVAENKEVAENFLRRSAEAGHPEALLLVGLEHLYGTLNRTLNVSEGIERIKTAAKMGSPRANRFLADIFRQGTFGCRINLKLAKQLERRANEIEEGKTGTW